MIDNGVLIIPVDISLKRNMRSSGARFGLLDAMDNKPVVGRTSVTSADNAKSATYAKMERELKNLREENNKLKSELGELKFMYKQLIQDNRHEKFDERRLNMMKSQVVQLEKQLLILSEGMSLRTSTLCEIENSLSCLADKCRSHISKETRGPAVLVDRADLINMVEKAESSRLKLYKSIENTSKENLSKPLLLVSDFIDPRYDGRITLLDVAMGDLSHINLRHVAKLESELCSLYKDLILLHGMLFSSQNNVQNLSSKHLNEDINDRMSTHMLKTCAQMKQCTAWLLELSMLYPNAPWPPLKKSPIKDITLEDISSSLPKLPKTKFNEVMQVIDALFKVFSFRKHMREKEIKVLKEEIKFHKLVYDLQVKYAQNLIDTVKSAYSQFEESMSTVLMKPLQDILDAYAKLTSTASEKALKTFLTNFKNNAEQLNGAVENFLTLKEGDEALSAYGEEFFMDLDRLVRQTQLERDALANDMKDVKQMQTQLNSKLQEILHNETVVSENEYDSRKEQNEFVNMRDGNSVSDSLQNLSINSSSSNPQRPDVKQKKSMLTEVEDLSMVGSDVPATSKQRKKPPKNNSVPVKSPPVVCKTNYVQNTSVPIRTLKLIRSSSLSRLSDRPGWDTSTDVLPTDDQD